MSFLMPVLEANPPVGLSLTTGIKKLLLKSLHFLVTIVYSEIIWIKLKLGKKICLVKN